MILSPALHKTMLERRTHRGFLARDAVRAKVGLRAAGPRGVSAAGPRDVHEGQIPRRLHENPTKIGEVTPSSREVLDDIVGEHEEIERELVHVELLMGEGHAAS